MSILARAKTKLLGSIPLVPRTVHQRRYTRPLPTQLEASEIPKTSVIIPTRNRPDELEHCIDSILRQTVLPDEVLVVDDGNLPSLEYDVLFAGSGIDFRYVKKTEPGIAASRNMGVGLAKGEIIFFVDDDVVLEPAYIEETLRVFMSDPEKEVGGVDGHYVNKFERKGTEKLARAIFGLYLDRFEGVVLPNGYSRKTNSFDFPVVTQFFWGIAAFRREVFHTHSLYFDEANYPGYSQGEDSEFAYRVSAAFKLVYTPFARFRHEVGDGGRPKSFRRGVQQIHCAYKNLALNNELGLLNYLLMGWFFTGLQSLAFYKLVKPSANRRRAFWRLAGHTAGIASIPFSIPSRNGFGSAFAQWLSEVEE